MIFLRFKSLDMIVLDRKTEPFGNNFLSNAHTKCKVKTLVDLLILFSIFPNKVHPVEINKQLEFSAACLSCRRMLLYVHFTESVTSCVVHG